MATILRYVCVADGCKFCEDDEESAENHAEQWGDSHDILKVEYDPYYKKAKVKFIDTNTINTETS